MPFSRELAQRETKKKLVVNLNSDLQFYFLPWWMFRKVLHYSSSSSSSSSSINVF